MGKQTGTANLAMGPSLRSKGLPLTFFTLLDIGSRMLARRELGPRTSDMNRAVPNTSCMQTVPTFTRMGQMLVYTYIYIYTYCQCKLCGIQHMFSGQYSQGITFRWAPIVCFCAWAGIGFEWSPIGKQWLLIASFHNIGLG